MIRFKIYLLLGKKTRTMYYVESVKLWTVLVHNIVLQSTLTIVTCTNVYELGWCKLQPEFEADMSRLGFSICWPNNGCSSLTSSNSLFLGSKQQLWRLWESTSIATVNSNERNHWRRGVVINTNALGLDNNPYVSRFQPPVSEGYYLRSISAG